MNFPISSCGVIVPRVVIHSAPFCDRLKSARNINHSRENLLFKVIKYKEVIERPGHYDILEILMANMI